MRETVFRFKRFNVINKESAMKVGTDGVLLGAWCDVYDASSILDIGSGTGLIALMCAQRSNAHITAIEIDETAAKEAKENFANSPWDARIEQITADFSLYYKVAEMKFDHIISNPPFFNAGLTSPETQRATARHATVSLSFETLLQGCFSLITENGRISIIIPYDCSQTIENIVAGLNLFISRKTIVYPNPGAEPKRILWEFSGNPQLLSTTELTIEKERHIYTDEYISLTKDFYLKM